MAGPAASIAAPIAIEVAVVTGMGSVRATSLKSSPRSLTVHNENGTVRYR
jgi:hypothetical protein